MTGLRLSREEFAQMRLALSMAFPNCIAAEGKDKRPLKININADLMTEGRRIYPALTRRMVAQFLALYCRRNDYQKTIVKGAVRVDLDGNFAGFVSAAEAAHAQQMIREHRARGRAGKDGSGPKKGPSAAAGENLSDKLKQSLETLGEKLARLQHWHMVNGMSDGFYHSNGRAAEAEREIAAVQRQIEERGRDAIA